MNSSASSSADAGSSGTVTSASRLDPIDLVAPQRLDRFGDLGAKLAQRGSSLASFGMRLARHFGPFEQVHRSGVGIARAPHFLGGEHEHRRQPAHQRVEQRVEHGPVGAAPLGLEARLRVHFAIEDVLADIEVEGRQVLVAEVGQRADVGVEVEIVDRVAQLLRRARPSGGACSAPAPASAATSSTRSSSLNPSSAPSR